MDGNNIFEELFAADVEQTELEQIFGEHFKTAMGLTANEIVYPGHDFAYALRLRYDDNLLAEITPGPKLTSDDIGILKNRVKNELLSSDETGVGRAFLFTAVPVEGYFRYRDLFQILPVPPEAPRPTFQMGEQPFALEFRFPTSTNAGIRQIRRAFLERELELVLNGVLKLGVHGIGRMAGYHWVLPQQDVSIPWRSAYLQEMYTWPGGLLEAKEFTDVTEIPDLAKIEPSEYYAPSGITANQHLEIPSNLFDLLDGFFRLSRKDKERFLRACFWFQHARIVHTYSRSAAFTALISAVEAFIQQKRGAPICEMCRRPIGPGPTQQFVDFVEHFASTSEVPEADRRKFYGIRSALSHGGSLLPSDRRTWAPGLSPGRITEWDDLGTMWRLVRIILVNWLSLFPVVST